VLLGTAGLAQLQDPMYLYCMIFDVAWRSDASECPAIMHTQLRQVLY